VIKDDFLLFIITSCHITIFTHCYISELLPVVEDLEIGIERMRIVQAGY